MKNSQNAEVKEENMNTFPAGDPCRARKQASTESEQADLEAMFSECTSEKAEGR
jgi:hypothetical protein